MYSTGRRGAAYNSGLVAATDAEVAQYSKGVSRREFVKYVGEGAVLLLAIGCDKINPASPSNPSRPINVTGRVYDTGEFPNGFSFSNYKLTFSGQAAAVSGGDFSADLMSGTSYRAKIEILDETGMPSSLYLGPSELTVSFENSGNYDFDVLRADGTFRKFLAEVAFGGGSTGVAYGPIKRPDGRRKYVIDASFPQGFIDSVIKNVILNDVPRVCKGRLLQLTPTDTPDYIEVSGSMPDKNGPLAKGKFFVYNGPRWVNTGPSQNSTCDTGYAEFNERGGRAVASQEILQLHGFWGDTGTACPIGCGTLPSIFDDKAFFLRIERPTEHDVRMGHHVYSREPGTKWPDTRP